MVIPSLPLQRFMDREHEHVIANYIVISLPVPMQHFLCVQDLGCCYGQDTRQLILDGWRHQELAAIDLVPDYW